MSDGPRDAPVGYSVEERLALRFGQHLRVPNPIDTTVLGNHGGSNGEWTGPRTAPDLIQARNDIISLAPVEALNFEAGRFGTELGTCTSRVHEARITPKLRALGQLLLRSVG